MGLTIFQLLISAIFAKLLHQELCNRKNKERDHYMLKRDSITLLYFRSKTISI